MPADEMKACPSPWCEHGAVPRPIHYSGIRGQQRWFVICEDCDMTGPTKDSEAEAIAAWNTRPSTPPDVVERLSALLETHDMLNSMSDVVVVRADDLRAAIASLSASGCVRVEGE